MDADKRQQLDKLLQNPRIGLAGTTRPPQVLPTGFAELDKLLHGGWPAGALTELFVDSYGSGELSVLLPALQQLTGLLVWVAPPYLPYAPALQAAGLDLSRLMLVNADDDSDTLWSLEQALHSPACAAAFAWVGRAGMRNLRRLQLAAEQHGSWAVVFRPRQALRLHSVAALRVQLQRVDSDTAEGSSCLQLTVLKNRFGRSGSVRLDV